MPFFILYHMSILSSYNDGCPNGSMGFGFGMEDPEWKRHNRWLFRIPGISAGPTPALPPKKGARPSIQMKEEMVQHISEVIYFPVKAEWKTMSLVLYDLRCNENVVFDWLTNIYNPNPGDITFSMPLESINNAIDGTNGIKIPICLLELYSGCGDILEQWIYENVYPSEINWGELDMDSSEVVVVEMTLRFDRAYFIKQ